MYLARYACSCTQDHHKLIILCVYLEGVQQSVSVSSFTKIYTGFPVELSHYATEWPRARRARGNNRICAEVCSSVSGVQQSVLNTRTGDST